MAREGGTGGKGDCGCGSDCGRACAVVVANTWRRRLLARFSERSAGRWLASAALTSVSAAAVACSQPELSAAHEVELKVAPHVAPSYREEGGTSGATDYL